MKLQQETEVNVDAIKTWTETPEGWLQIDIPLCRPGVLTYDRSKGDAFTAKEYRSEDELFNPDSMNTLIGKPVTLVLHPKGGKVTAKNFKAVSVGTVAGVRREGDDLVARALIQDENSIKLVKNDKTLRGASAGYQCDEKPKVTGDSPWGRYDTVMKGIKYNHLTICRNPRNTTARFNLDNKGNQMDELEELQANLDSVTKERDGLQKKLGEVQGELLKANKQVINLDSQTTEAYERGVKDGKEQHLLNEHAKKLGVNVDSLDAKQIKLAVIKKATPDLNTDSWTDEQIDVGLQMAMATKPVKAFTQTHRATVNTDTTNDGNGFSDYQNRIFKAGKKEAK